MFRFPRRRSVESVGHSPAPTTELSAIEPRTLEAWNSLCESGRKFELVEDRETFLIHVADPIGKEIYLTGEYDFRKFGIALHFLGRSRIGTLVDVGANVGSICIPALTRGLTETAIAIEPDPVNHALLTANIAMNGLTGKVVCHQVAAGPIDGASLTLELDYSNFGNHRIVAGQRTHNGIPSVTVQSRRLDALIDHLDPSTDLIYMDVQGFEKFVLDGSRAFIDAGVPIVMELWPAGIQDHCTFDELMSVISRYDAYVDLNRVEPVVTPMHDLEKLWDGLLRGDYGFGDILLLDG